MFRITASLNIFKEVIEYFGKEQDCESNVLVYGNKDLPANVMTVKSNKEEFSVVYIESINQFKQNKE